MLEKGEIIANFEKAIGEIDRNIYGHLIEHWGNIIYGGLYVLDKTPNVGGWREDTLELVRALNPPIIRWPGGIFSQNYHWEDGIGPVKDRPLKMDWFYAKLEPNIVGTHEFLNLCRMVKAEPYVVVNVDNGSPEEAARWVKYCNSSETTKEGKLRANNGHPSPFNVKYWGVGNENWLEAKADYSAKRFIEYAKSMKEVDPEIKLVASGGCGHDGEPGFKHWNKTMLEIAGKYIDYIAPHHYDGIPAEDPNLAKCWKNANKKDAYYANIVSSERIIKTAAYSARHIDEILGNRSNVGVALDEWGIFKGISFLDAVRGMMPFEYNLSDGLLAASVLNGLQKLCRRVTMACWALLVNAFGLIRVDEKRAWPTPIYHVLKLYGTLCGNQLVKSFVDCGSFNTKAMPKQMFDTLQLIGRARARPPMHDVPLLDVSATKNSENNRFVLTIVNRHIEKDIRCRLDLSGLPCGLHSKVYVINAQDALTYNTSENPNAVSIHEKEIGNQLQSYTSPAHSISVLLFKK
jgi:alpha-N-arabinofuranosidase